MNSSWVMVVVDSCCIFYLTNVVQLIFFCLRCELLKHLRAHFEEEEKNCCVVFKTKCLKLFGIFLVSTVGSCSSQYDGSSQFCSQTSSTHTYMKSWKNAVLNSQKMDLMDFFFHSFNGIEMFSTSVQWWCKLWIQHMYSGMNSWMMCKSWGNQNSCRNAFDTLCKAKIKFK